MIAPRTPFPSPPAGVASERRRPDALVLRFWNNDVLQKGKLTSALETLHQGGVRRP
jgi:hypothetical protein